MRSRRLPPAWLAVHLHLPRHDPDDCWAYDRDIDSGTLTWDTSRFPNGIPALADWLHNEGFLLGLYTSAGNETCSNGGRPLTIPGSEGFYSHDTETFGR